MEKYKVFLKPSAVKELKAIARKQDRQRIVRRIGQLAHDPRPPGCQKLSARELYRLRQGNFRIVYQVRDAALIVHVVKVADHKDVYRQ